MTPAPRIGKYKGDNMPWKSGGAFASKHNKKLHGAAASKAAKVATALVKKGMPEGEAIATANKVGNKAMRGKGLINSKK